MRDPYAVLGVERTASDAEIKNAYRRHAKRLHPDMHDGDAGLEARFQDIQNAYALLKDRARRRQFDQGEINARGEAIRPSFEDALNAARAAGAAGEETAQPGQTSKARQDRDTLFSEFLATFRKARRNIETEPPPRAAAAQAAPSGPITLSLTFAEAVTGTRKTVVLSSGKRVAITVPPGAENGQTIQMRNASPSQAPGAVPTELSVVLSVASSPQFTREGDDLVTTLPITLDEALLGARVRLDAPGGELLVTVPRGSNTGQVLKLRGRGVPKADGEAGDLRITLTLKLPPVIDSELEAVIKSWASRHPYSVRD